MYQKNEIIVVKQLPIIIERLQEIKADVTAKVETALSLVCTEDTVKDVKVVRAELNKEFKEFEEQRKEVKNKVMKPYEAFESVYRDCITDVFKKADTELKSKIDDVENDLKQQKTYEVFMYFEELCEANGLDFFTWENANINVTLSASLKSLKEQAKTAVDKVCDDLKLIDTQEHKQEILYEYKKSLNVTNAITSVVNRHNAMVEMKATEEEQKLKMQAEAEAVAKVDTVIEELKPPIIEQPIEEEKILTVSFKVKGTRTQLKAIKLFLDNGGYDYE